MMWFHLFTMMLISFSRYSVIEGCSTRPVTATKNDFTVTFNLNCTDETVTVTIQFDDYDGAWWGVIFSGNMKGNALIYTTGKSGDTVSEGLWPYVITGWTLSSVSRDTSTTWTEISTVEDGTTMTVQYRADLSDTQWSTTTESVTWGAAEGASSNGLTIASKHESRISSQVTMDISATSEPTTSQPQPTVDPTINPTISPIADPTTSPTTVPTTPTFSPSGEPSMSPTTGNPTAIPTPAPTMSPTLAPTAAPTNTGETHSPSSDPTSSPSADPTVKPTGSPSDVPTDAPTNVPSNALTTDTPTSDPTSTPTVESEEGYRLCVDVAGTSGVQLQILRNKEAQMMKIKIIGPTTRWFGFGFGSSSMPNTYTVIGAGSDLEVVERILASNAAGTQLSASGNSSVVEDGSSRTLVLQRGYDEDGTFDFTDFMDCSTTTISVISAKGNAHSFGYHSSRKSGVAVNECCVDTTTAPDDNVSAANMRFGLVAVLCICTAFVFVQ